MFQWISLLRKGPLSARARRCYMTSKTPLCIRRRSIRLIDITGTTKRVEGILHHGLTTSIPTTCRPNPLQIGKEWKLTNLSRVWPICQIQNQVLSENRGRSSQLLTRRPQRFQGSDSKRNHRLQRCVPTVSLQRRQLWLSISVSWPFSTMGQRCGITSAKQWKKA